MRALWVAGLVAAIGCGQTGTTPATKASTVQAPKAQPAAPSGPDERDLLWALAPEGATFGLVVSPRGVALVERAAAAVQALLGSSPDFASMNSEVMRALLRRVGSMNPTLAGFGMSHDKGFALFVAGDDQVVLVPPVADRNRFLTAVSGSMGADGDVVGTWVCKPISGRYVCVQRRTLFARLGRGALDGVRRSAGARGEIELAGRGVVEPLGGTIAAVAELDRGTLIVRGTVGRAARAIVDVLGAPTRLSGDPATAAGFGIIDLAPVLLAQPPAHVAPGITFRDLSRSIAGPLSYVIPGGTADPGIRVPLRDPGAARALVEHCAELPPLAQVGATARDGTCRIPVASDTTFDAWVDGKELRVADRAAKPSPIAPSRLAGELGKGAWSAALFARGSYLDLRKPRLRMPVLPQELDGLLRGWSLINEIGFGLRKDGDSVHFLAGVRTVWANPDDVLHKLLTIPIDDLLSDKAVEIGKSIAAAAPRSPFAQDFQAGTAGLAGFGTVLGTLRAVALPAWTTRARRAKYIQGEVHLAGGSRKPPGGFPLVAARAQLKTTIFMKADRTPAPEPPKELFVKTHYHRGKDDLVAYETPPRPGARRPAIIWIHGGFQWDIDADLWKPAPRSNDQTASQLRRDDLVVMFPALRGFSGNPGNPECFLGEVDDILAAAEHLAKRPDVDPARIYLGGHSTGGTLALLAAASTDRFRAVFSFGPMPDPRFYGDSSCLPWGKPAAEYEARSPMNWVGSIVTPTLVIEGEHSDNVEGFAVLQERASPAVQFAAIADADHGSVLAPATEAIARAILADTGPTVSITLDTAAIARGVEHAD